MAAKRTACLLLAQMSMASAAPLPPSIGFVQMGPDGVYLHVARSAEAIRNVVIQFPDESGRVRCCMNIGARDLASPIGSEDVQQVGDSAGGTVLRYTVLRMEPAFATRGPFIGLALTNVRAPVRSTTNSITARSATGQAVKVERCLGSEGINAMTRTALPVKQLYFALGYEIDVTEVGAARVCGK